MPWPVAINATGAPEIIRDTVGEVGVIVSYEYYHNSSCYLLFFPCCIFVPYSFIMFTFICSCIYFDKQTFGDSYFQVGATSLYLW